jgi:hypothetical protein
MHQRGKRRAAFLLRQKKMLLNKEGNQDRGKSFAEGELKIKKIMKRLLC